MEMDNWSKLLISLRVDEKYPLIPGTGGSTSKRTREPAPYNKHLSSDLIPMHTEILDSLAGILVEKAEARIKLMQDADKDQPPDELLFTKRPMPKEVMGETGICYWYSKRADTWCQIAAALRLHNGNWDCSMLEYTMDLMPHYAQADGAILVLSDTSFNHLVQELPLSINDEMRAVWKVLCERTVQNTIISWEFKSLFSGSRDIMESIVRVIRLGSFRWEFCGENKSGLPSNEMPDDGGESGPTRKRQRLLPEEGEDGEKKETTRSATPDDSHGSDYQDKKKAQNIIQQVWAQACIKDLTYFVIHSGNFELICIRHRGSRTLYCSDLVERCKNKYPYGLLQVGIYLEAIDDAVKRCHEADTSAAGSGGEGDGGGGTGDNGSASDERPGGPSGGGAEQGVREGAGGRPTTSAAGTQPPRRSARNRTRAMAPLALEDEVMYIDNAIKNGAKAIVRLKYGVYDSVCPWIFDRVDLLRRSECPESRHANNSFSVILTSEISSDKGTVVHGGAIASTENGTVSRSIIMKLGFNEDKPLIEGEYNIYKHLQQNGVPTPKVHGLFQCRDPDGATAILMDHAGTRIDQVPGGLSEAQRTTFCGLLQQIHNAGVLHYDIATRNLLVSDTGEPFIVDFGNAVVVDRKKRKVFKGEMKQLHRVLGQCASEKGPHF